MSLIPERISFERVRIRDIKSIADVSKWLSGFIVEFDRWYSKFYDWSRNPSIVGKMTFTGSGRFFPRFLTQSVEPVAGTGSTQIDVSEMAIWKDSDDLKVYILFNDSGTVKKVELT